MNVFKVLIYINSNFETIKDTLKLADKFYDNSFKSISEILNIIKNDLNNGDFLMIKGSNSTGLNQIIKQIGSKS